MGGGRNSRSPHDQPATGSGHRTRRRRATPFSRIDVAMTAANIQITRTALDTATTAGLAALPRKTGGILLGFRAKPVGWCSPGCRSRLLHGAARRGQLRRGQWRLTVEQRAAVNANRVRATQLQRHDGRGESAQSHHRDRSHTAELRSPHCRRQGGCRWTD